MNNEVTIARLNPNKVMRSKLVDPGGGDMTLELLVELSIAKLLLEANEKRDNKNGGWQIRNTPIFVVLM